MIALGIILLAMSSYRTPAVALMPDVTPKPLRSKANAVINLMGTIGGMYALGMTFLLYKEDGGLNIPVFASVIFIMILSVVFLLVTIKENKLREKVREEEKVFNSGKDHSDETDNADENMSKDVKRSFGFILASIFLFLLIMLLKPLFQDTQTKYGVMVTELIRSR